MNGLDWCMAMPVCIWIDFSRNSHVDRPGGLYRVGLNETELRQDGERKREERD